MDELAFGFALVAPMAILEAFLAAAAVREGDRKGGVSEHGSVF